MPGSDAQNGTSYQAYRSVRTDPANVWIGVARWRVSRRMVGPGDPESHGRGERIDSGVRAVLRYPK